jgi:hypothetical protein
MSRYYRSILNVQGVAPFTPTKIAGCQLWLDASDATTISIGTGVSQWNDKSGNARHAMQATGASQPAYITAGKNGLNIVRFDGSNDGVEGAYTELSQCTIFVVAINNSGDFGRVFTQVTTGQTDDFNIGIIPILRKGASNELSIYNASIANFQADVVYDNTWKLMKHERGATNTTLKIGALSSTVANSAIGTVDRYRLGFNTSSNAQMNGDIAEVVVYNSVLSAGDTTLIETYLNDKWAI